MNKLCQNVNFIIQKYNFLYKYKFCVKSEKVLYRVSSNGLLFGQFQGVKMHVWKIQIKAGCFQ